MISKRYSREEIRELLDFLRPMLEESDPQTLIEELEEGDYDFIRDIKAVYVMMYGDQMKHSKDFKELDMIFKDMFEQERNPIYQITTDEFSIYRGLTVKDEVIKGLRENPANLGSLILTKKVGVYWAYSLAMALEFIGGNSSAPNELVLKSHTQTSHIDWLVSLFLHGSFDEGEVRVYPNTHLFLDEIGFPEDAYKSQQVEWTPCIASCEMIT